MVVRGSFWNSLLQLFTTPRRRQSQFVTGDAQLMSCCESHSSSLNEGLLKVQLRRSVSYTHWAATRYVCAHMVKKKGGFMFKCLIRPCSLDRNSNLPQDA